VELPSKTIIDYKYKGGNDFTRGEVELIDLQNSDILEGDGKVDFRCNELVDLLSRQRAIASDVLFHAQQKKNTDTFLMSKQEEHVKRVRAQAFMRLSASGWAHKEKGGDVIKASSGVLEDIVDGDEEVIAEQIKLSEMQKDVANLNAKIQSLERFYFNCDSSIKQLSKMLGGY
jgi:hypothetical protein